MVHTWRIYALAILVSVACGRGLGVVGECNCQDKQPRDSDPCSKQKEIGNCEESWMVEGGYCERSCNRCDCDIDAPRSGCDECNDRAPADEFTCEEQKTFGKCSEEWMKPFCQITCGTCKCETEGLNGQQIEVISEEAPGVPVPQMQNGAQPDPIEHPAPKALNVAAPDQDNSQPRLQSSRAPDDKLITSPLNAPAPSAPKVTPAPIEKGKTCSKTVLDVLEEGEGFSTLVEVLKITGMAEALDKLGAPLALFAPHDTAFEHFFDDFKISSEEFYTTHSGKAEAILQYHIVPNVEDPDALIRSLEPLDTLLSSKKLFAAGKSTIESLASSAKILSTPLPVCGSSIFIIDTVLLPAPSLEGIGLRRAIQQPQRSHSVSSLPAAHPAPVYSGAKCSEKGSLAETIAADPHLNIFSKALEHCGLAKKYLAAWDDEITVLAPTDTAFRNYLLQSEISQEDLFAEKKKLESLLKYHLVPGNVDGKSMKQGSLQTLNPKPVFVEVLPTSVEIAGLGSSARVLALDVDRRCNGALHKIDQVLLPHSMTSGTDAKPGNIQRTSQKPPKPQTLSGPSNPISTPPRACESITDVIASKANLQILHRAIKLAGLYNMLSDKLQSITLFAPTDNAFLALSKSASQLPILTDPAALKSILGYHALSKAVEFDDLRPGKDLSTNVWNDDAPVMLSVVEHPNRPNKITLHGIVGKATIVQRDIVACDSIVHIIDGVLLPADTIDKIKSQPSEGSLSLWTG